MRELQHVGRKTMAHGWSVLPPSFTRVIPAGPLIAPVFVTKTPVGVPCEGGVFVQIARDLLTEIYVHMDRCDGAVVVVVGGTRVGHGLSMTYRQTEQQEPFFYDVLLLKQETTKVQRL